MKTVSLYLCRRRGLDKAREWRTSVQRHRPLQDEILDFEEMAADSLYLRRCAVIALAAFELES